jgi:tRNA A37 threonylcarbamoyladenosine modification protein TsaB
MISDDKHLTSKFFILGIEELLSRNRLIFADIAFCAVNCGPGPFSTIRSILASVNGLHCATGVPLVSIDGLEATFLEFYNNAYKNTIVVVNAFNNESYYLVARNECIVRTGYKKTELLNQEIAEEFSHSALNIIDNKTCSIETVARLGYEKYGAQKSPSGYLMPLYLKKHPVEQ